MQRRKFLIGIGAVTAGSAATVGTGAFTSATVKGRSVNVSTTGDGSAYVQLNADHSGANSKYASYDSNGKLQLDFGSLNQNSSFSFDHVFEIKNQGTQSVDVHISNDTSSGINFYWGDGSSAEDASNAKTIAVGESLTVGVEIPDTSNMSGGKITISANA